MTDGLNRVMLFGNLGADPEVNVTRSGETVMKLRLACTESFLDRNRVRQERTEWVSIVVWGRRAEALGKFLKKGAKIFVEGKLTTRSWEDQSGRKNYRTEVVAHNVVLSGGAKARSAPDDPERRRSRRDHYDEPGASGAAQSRDDSDYGYSGGDDDIPF